MPEISEQLVEKLAQHVAALAAAVEELTAESSVSEETQRLVQKAVDAKVCLRCHRTIDTDVERYTRGLCQNDYNQAVKLWQSGDVSAREMMQAGKLAPATRGGRKAINPSVPSDWTTPITDDELIAALPKTPPEETADYVAKLALDAAANRSAKKKKPND